MPRKTTPTFVHEMPLRIDRKQRHALVKRFEVMHFPYNVVLQEMLRKIDAMRVWLAGSLAHLDYCDCCAMEDAQEDGHDPAQRPALGCRSGANDRNPSAASSLGER